MQPVPSSQGKLTAPTIARGENFSSFMFTCIHYIYIYAHT